jgi:hypothetical protein
MTTPERPLTGQQRQRLVLAAFYGITADVAKSMPSLERRGLAEKYWRRWNGRRNRMWRLTAAGYRVAEQLRRGGQMASPEDT